MASILLTIHIIVAIGLVTSVLLQRSEGGLGGIGGGMSNVMSSQSGNNFITKLTLYLATGFIITSISLTVLSLRSNDRSLSFDNETIELPEEIEDLPELPQLD